MGGWWESERHEGQHGRVEEHSGFKVKWSKEKKKEGASCCPAVEKEPASPN